MKIAIAPVAISLGARSKAVDACASEPIGRDFKLAGEVGSRVRMEAGDPVSQRRVSNSHLADC
jgi:hypothetical protein